VLTKKFIFLFSGDGASTFAVTEALGRQNGCCHNAS